MKVADVLRKTFEASAFTDTLRRTICFPVQSTVKLIQRIGKCGVYISCHYCLPVGDYSRAAPHIMGVAAFKISLELSLEIPLYPECDLLYNVFNGMTVFIIARHVNMHLGRHWTLRTFFNHSLSVAQDVVLHICNKMTIDTYFLVAPNLL